MSRGYEMSRDDAAVQRRPGSPDPWRHAVAIPVALLCLLPLLYMLAGSVRAPGLPPPTTPELIPSGATLESYERALALLPLVRQAVNSSVVALISVPVSVIVASWAALGMVMLPARPRRAVIVVSLLALMVPLSAVLVGRFAIFRTLGVLDTYVPLIAPALLGMSPFYVLLLYWAFRGVPRELYDVARVEGLGILAIWRRVALPLAWPAVGAVAILAFITSWASFVEPLVYLFDARNFTLPLGLRSLAELDRSDFPVFLAGAVITTLPVLAAVVIMQRLLGGSRRRREQA